MPNRSERPLSAWRVLVMLGVVVLIPTVCVLWFMNQAMHNERMAVRQRLLDAYQIPLNQAKERLESFWNEQMQRLDHMASNASAPDLFARAVRNHMADGLIVFDPDGQVAYPDSPAAGMDQPPAPGENWSKAGRFENIESNFTEAAKLYEAIAGQETNHTVVARALQAQARCLVKANRAEAALEILAKMAADPRLGQAADESGRLIIPNAQFMMLELINDPNDSIFAQTLEQLQERLNDYDRGVMSASQRRFLMRGLAGRWPAEIALPMLAAEDLADQFLREQSRSPMELPEIGLRAAPRTNLWQLTSPSKRWVALLHSQTVRSLSRQALEPVAQPADTRLELIAPGASPSPETHLASLSAGSTLPGWRLGLLMQDRHLLHSAANQRIAAYLWTGLAMLGAMSLLAIALGRMFNRQLALTRLKNDLVASVTHELKTPLASMRLLVDTLLQSERIDETTARDYLQLIAKENSRLSHLIDNFLAFSRMERNKFALDFRETSAREVADSALTALQERLGAPGCQLEVHLPSDPKPFLADPDALVTALINLLDNAWKYSREVKKIALRAFEQNGKMIFEVSDNGIGLTPRESKRIFRQFYQVDQSLSRGAGGCGLGLSIVQFIVQAHQGAVQVESQPGQGSTFRLVLPQERPEHRNR